MGVMHGMGRLEFVLFFGEKGKGERRDLLNTITGAFIMAARAWSCSSLCLPSCCWLPVVGCGWGQEHEVRGAEKRERHDGKKEA